MEHGYKGEFQLMEDIIKNILETVSQKKVKSLCTKILKKFSFSSERDLKNIADLATWLYIYEYYDEMLKVCDLLANMTFEDDYNIWAYPDLCMCLKSRVYKEKGLIKESQDIVKTINEHRHPELYINVANEFEMMDFSISEELKNRPESLAAISRFGKLKFDITYKEAGKFPVPDEVFEEDIKNLISILRQVK